MKLTCFHTTDSMKGTLKFPELSDDKGNWLGDGFYFWQDYEFAEWWGDTDKCKTWNKSRQYDIYESDLEFKNDEFIDTVFNQEDYYYFLKTIEKYAKKYQRIFREKPNLSEFNLFLKKHKIWQSINIIRFQDIPEKNALVEVTGFYYKKRIQIRVYKPDLISSFDPLIRKDCII
jgi:hypothetical protein